MVVWPLVCTYVITSTILHTKSDSPGRQATLSGFPVKHMRLAVNYFLMILTLCSLTCG